MIPVSIIKTLTYSAHFSYPLTKAELQSRLVKIKITSQSSFNQSLKDLIRSHQIESSRGYYYLPGQSSLVDLRLQKTDLAKPAQNRAKTLATVLSRVPGILAIYLTGSLAVSNSDSNSDLDFMIITKANRLWTTRLLLTLYSELLHLRRRPGMHDSPGKVCLNLYLTPKSYHLPSSKQSLYTAYELIQAVPLYDPHHTHPNLLLANSWLWEYLPNYPRPSSKPHPVNPKTSGFSLLSLLEKFSYHLQLRYMSSRITREYITPDSAFFHPHNPGKSVLQKLKLNTG